MATFRNGLTKHTQVANDTKSSMAEPISCQLLDHGIRPDQVTWNDDDLAPSHRGAFYTSSRKPLLKKPWYRGVRMLGLAVTFGNVPERVHPPPVLLGPSTCQ